MGLEAGVADEGGLGLFGFGQAEVSGANNGHVERRQKIGDLFQLATVMRGDEKAIPAVQHYSPRAARCAVTRAALP